MNLNCNEIPTDGGMHAHACYLRAEEMSTNSARIGHGWPPMRIHDHSCAPMALMLIHVHWAHNRSSPPNGLGYTVGLCTTNPVTEITGGPNNQRLVIIHLDIRLPHSSPYVLSLPGLPIRYPQLRKLWLKDNSPGAQPLWGVQSKIALTLNRIESLTVDKLDRPAIEHFAQLPALKSLSLEVPDLMDLRPSSQFRSLMEPQTRRFSSLRDLDLGNTTIEFAIEFLDLLSNCCLVEFYVSTTVLAEKSTTRRFYAALANHLSHSTLQILFVDVPEGDEIEAPATLTLANYVVDGSILAAALCFVNLTEIILLPPVGFDIDDAMAWDIARAWPRVHYLSLTAATELHHPSSMSLRGLRAFATHCPELTHLSVTFGASTVPSFADSLTPELVVSQLVF
ncbi:hypothetical protein B0H12DRAFT_1279178 [Mycena haematopus]|nr:hypothetical protein B0H12DRAFT_1279178 [Mycena haematopus]